MHLAYVALRTNPIYARQLGLLRYYLNHRVANPVTIISFRHFPSVKSEALNGLTFV